MDKETIDLQEAIADLKRIKDAVSRSNSIISFMDTGGAVRGILLAGGLLIAVFAALFYYLLERFGSFAAIPENLRVILFVLLALAWCGIGYIKIRNFLRGARKISSEMTFFKLLDEIYTPRFQAVVLPNFAVIVLLVIFLASRGYEPYIIPSLALLVGLLTISISVLFFMKEIFILGLWLAATGIVVLFMAEAVHPLAALVLTFAAGFILASLFLYLGLPGERGGGR